MALGFRKPKMYASSTVVFSGALDGEILFSSTALELVVSDDAIHRVMEVLKIDQPLRIFRENIIAEGMKGGSSITTKACAEDPNLSEDVCENGVKVCLSSAGELYGRRKEFYERRSAVICEDTCSLKD